jgi:hypothetical protein
MICSQILKKSYSEIKNLICNSQLTTPELEEKHKKSEKRHLEYFRYFDSKNHQTSKKR